MADHIHLFEPGVKVTFTAGADVTGGRLLDVTGPREVSHAGTDSTAMFGAAARDTKEGEDVLVLRGGVQNLVGTGAISAGDRVKPATDGKVAPVGADEVGVGLALTTITAADQLVQVALDH